MAKNSPAATRKSRIVALPADWGFKPSYAMPSLDDVPKEYRQGLEDGSLAMLHRRSTTPNTFCIVPASAAGPENARWELSDTLFKFEAKPRIMHLFELKDECREIVDYGPSMADYIATYSSPVFADQGKPLWSRFVYEQARASRIRRRREKAEKSAAWFNAQQGRQPKTLQKLSDQALLLLSAPLSTQLYMYRGLAAAMLELVQAGYGTVNANGWLDRVGQEGALAAAVEERIRRRLEWRWEDPEYIQQRLRSHRGVHWGEYTSGRRKKPTLPYPISL